MFRKFKTLKQHCNVIEMCFLQFNKNVSGAKIYFWVLNFNVSFFSMENIVMCPFLCKICFYVSLISAALAGS
jgi:hypothetical protein